MGSIGHGKSLRLHLFFAQPIPDVVEVKIRRMHG